MEESDQKAGEDASGSDKMAGAASGSDEKAIDKRPPLRSRLSADAPAFIPRGHFQNRPPRSTSPVTPSTLSPVDTPPSVHSSSSTSSVSASSTGERRRHRPATDPRPQHRPAADSPGKGKASTTGKAGPHDRSHQRPASNSPHPALPPQNLARRFESSAPASSRPPVPALPQNLGPRVENSPPTSSRPPVPAFPLPPQNLGPHFEDSAPASSPVPTLPQNLGPRVENSPPASSRPPAPTVTHNLGPHTENYPPASSRPQVPAFSDVLRHGPATAAKMMQYKDAMLRYLNHESCDHYKEEASRLGRRLTIDFVDLMWKDKDLAENICNNRGTNTFWLKQAAKAFFDANNLPSDDVTLDFKNIPSRLLSARKHMETLPCTQRRSICGGITTINEATLHGRRGADVILTGILDCISAGVSWCGRLSFEDLWFGEEPDGTLKLYIAKQPTYTENAPTNYRVLDVKAIWPAIKGALSLVDGKLPLYFQELQSDLENARGLPDWFFTYLRFHPALYASMPHSNLIISVQKSCRRFKIASDKKFNRVFSGKPLSSGDWRRRAKTGALNQLLKFKLMEKNKGNKNSENSTNLESSAGKKKETGVTEEDSAGKAPGTSEGLEKTSGRSLGNVVMPTPMGASEDECQSPGTLYIDTTSSLLDYNRNGLSHLDQYVEIEDEDEIELYLAYHFPEILPAVIRGLLDECGMGGCFQSAWDTYKKTK